MISLYIVAECQSFTNTMLVLRDIKKVAVRSKPPMLAGQKVWRKYRQASIRLSEYRKLKAMVPSIAKKRRVSKVCVTCICVYVLNVYSWYIGVRCKPFVPYVVNTNCARQVG